MQKISLQVLFPSLPRISSGELAEQSAIHMPAFKNVVVNLPDDTRGGGFGTFHFFENGNAIKVNLEFSRRPLDSQAVEKICGYIGCAPETKELIGKHTSYIELSTESGTTQSGTTLQSYVRLTAIAAILAARGALVLANINGYTSFPVEQIMSILSRAGKSNWLDTIYGMPLLFLYSGLVALTFDNQRTLWLRTYGNHLFDLPDLGTAISLAELSSQVPVTQSAFDNVMRYMLESGKRVFPGQIIDGDTLKVQVKAQPDFNDELFYQSPSGLLCLEFSSN